MGVIRALKKKKMVKILRFEPIIQKTMKYMNTDFPGDMAAWNALLLVISAISMLRSVLSKLSSCWAIMGGFISPCLRDKACVFCLKVVDLEEVWADFWPGMGLLVRFMKVFIL